MLKIIGEAILIATRMEGSYEGDRTPRRPAPDPRDMPSERARTAWFSFGARAAR